MTALGSSFTMIDQFGASASAIAIGKFKGHSHGSDAIFGNPAALSRIQKNSLSAFNASILADLVHYSAFSFARAFGRHRIAIGRYSVQVNALSKVKQFQRIRHYDYEDRLFKLSYQYQYSDTFSLALSPVFYRQSQDTITGTGSNLDIGLLLERPRYYISALAQNILPNRSVQFSDHSDEFGTYEELLPLHLYFGTHVQVIDSVALLGQLAILERLNRDNRRQLYPLPSLGLIYRPLQKLQLRIGTYRDLSAALTHHQRHSIGMVLSLLRLSLAYTYQVNDYTSDPNQHLFSIQYQF